MFGDVEDFFLVSLIISYNSMDLSTNLMFSVTIAIAPATL